MASCPVGGDGATVQTAASAGPAPSKDVLRAVSIAPTITKALIGPRMSPFPCVAALLGQPTGYLALLLSSQRAHCGMPEPLRSRLWLEHGWARPAEQQGNPYLCRKLE
jgi:hypothetical protein